MFVGHTLKPRAFDFKSIIDNPEVSENVSAERDHQVKTQQVQYMKKLNFTLAQKKNVNEKKLMEYQSKRA